MFKKKSSGILDDQTAMRIVADGKVRDVSYRDLLLSMNLSLEALMSVLIKKGVISPEDLLGAIEEIRDKHASKMPAASSGSGDNDAGTG